MEIELEEHAPATTTVAAPTGSLPSRGEHRKLSSRLRRLIERRTSGQIHDLSVEVVEQGVLLGGRCATFYCKQLAQHAVMDSTERPVINRIDVSDAPRR